MLSAATLSGFCGRSAGASCLAQGTRGGAAGEETRRMEPKPASCPVTRALVAPSRACPRSLPTLTLTQTAAPSGQPGCHLRVRKWWCPWAEGPATGLLGAPPRRAPFPSRVPSWAGSGSPPTAPVTGGGGAAGRAWLNATYAPAGLCLRKAERKLPPGTGRRRHRDPHSLAWGPTPHCVGSEQAREPLVSPKTSGGRPPGEPGL